MPHGRDALGAKAEKPEERGPYRLTAGGALIDRTRPVAFFVNNVSFFGFEGDTLASALLAQGAAWAPRSPRYGRPRALVSAGADEPNAVFHVLDRRGGERARPATLTPLRPGLKAQAPLETGARQWLASALRSGRRGNSRSQPDASDGLAAGFDHEFTFHTDVLVVGGGVAGVAAAKAALACGARVLIAERAAHWGGRALVGRAKVGRGDARSWIDKEIATLEASEEATARLSLEVVSLDDPEGALLVERGPAPGPWKRLWRVRARRIVLASGASERGLLFSGNDLPGVMSASAMRDYLALYGVAAGRRAAVFTNNDSGYRAALDLAEAGVEIAAIVDPRPAPRGPDPRRAETMGLPIRAGCAVVAAIAAGAGRKAAIGAVEVAPLRASGRVGAGERVACDVLGVSGGWCPEARLFVDQGGTRLWDRKAQLARPAAGGAALPLQHGGALIVVGAANGATGLGEALAEGLWAGKEAAKASGFKVKRAALPKISGVEGADDAPPSPFFLSPSRQPQAENDSVFVAPAHDLTLAEIERAASGKATTVGRMLEAVGLSEPLSAPAETLAASVIADMRGARIDDALASERVAPAVTPAPRSPVVTAVRETPMGSWHAEHGAVFPGESGATERPVWRAPRAFLRQSGPDGELEDDLEATAREARLARRGVGVHDASYLTKLRIEGPEADAVAGALFARRVDDLAIGRCRIGVLRATSGAALSEGALSRLDEDAFMLHAPPEVAEALGAHLQGVAQGRQAQWADLTEVFSQIAIIGPKSRAVLERLTEADLSDDALPALCCMAARLAGRELRLYRVARAGGLGFEIEVGAAQARAVWDAVFEAGRALGLQALGTDALDVLRIERGRPAPGREADGVAIARDLVWGAQDGAGAPAGRRLVGLAPEDPSQAPPENAAVYPGEGSDRGFVARSGSERGGPAAIGRVTSSCWSPNLERAIALALVEGGAARLGEIVHLYDSDRRLMRLEIAAPRFIDPSAQNIDGWRPL